MLRHDLVTTCTCTYMYVALTTKQNGSKIHKCFHTGLYYYTHVAETCLATGQ